MSPPGPPYAPQTPPVAPCTPQGPPIPSPHISGPAAQTVAGFPAAAAALSQRSQLLGCPPGPPGSSWHPPNAWDPLSTLSTPGAFAGASSTRKHPEPRGRRDVTSGLGGELGATGRNWEARGEGGRAAPLPTGIPTSTPPPFPSHISNHSPFPVHTGAFPVRNGSSFPHPVWTGTPTTIPSLYWEGVTLKPPSHFWSIQTLLVHAAIHSPQLPGLSFICAIGAP